MCPQIHCNPSSLLFTWHVCASPHFPPQYQYCWKLIPLYNKVASLTPNWLSQLDHTSNVCRTAHFHIRALTEDMAEAVAVSLIHARIYYANSVVHGQTNIKRLQSVQNSVVRVVLKNRPALSTSELIHELHRLPL